jgi:hypothetical protein
VLAQGTVNIGEVRPDVVRLDLLDPPGVVDLGPEVVGVLLYSVVAVVGFRYHNRKHLALRTRKL